MADHITHKENDSLDSVRHDSAENLQILEKPRRRTFSRSYKLKILDKIEEAKSEWGGVGRLLRCEGLYSTQITKWRKELSDSKAKAFNKKRGPRATKISSHQISLEKTERKIKRLEAELEETQMILDIQKKLSDLLGIKLPNSKIKNS